MPRSNSSTTDPLLAELPLQGQLIPIMRQWLAKGVSDGNLRSSTRVRAWTPLSGGLKSPLVAEVELSLRVVIKQGSAELQLHERLMNAVNCHAASRKQSVAGLQNAVFPEVMLVDKLTGQPATSDHLMVQQALVGYEPVSTTLFDSGRNDVWRSVRPGLLALAVLHDLPEPKRGSLSHLGSTKDPFISRITERLEKLRATESWINGVWTTPSTIDGLNLAPLKDLVPRLRRWQLDQTPRVELRLVHGDAHLANLMTRSRGRYHSVRWIDPNPTLGFSDPAYDWGKVLHFAEAVGWAKHDSSCVRTAVRVTPKQVSVRTSLMGVPASREARRAELEREIRRAGLRALRLRSNPVASLELAIASAHIGLAALDLTPGPAVVSADKVQRGRFALVRTLAALARWSAAVSTS